MARHIWGEMEFSCPVTQSRSSMNLSIWQKKKTLATWWLCSERKEQNKTHHIKSKLDSSKLICTNVVVGAGGIVKRATQAKRGHGFVIWAVFIQCVQQISRCSLGLSQGEESGQRHQLSAGRLLRALSPCRAGKVSLINLKLKCPSQ